MPGGGRDRSFERDGPGPPRRYNSRGSDRRGSRSRSYSPDRDRRRGRSRSRSPPRRSYRDSPPRRSFSPDRGGPRGGYRDRDMGYGPPPGRGPPPRDYGRGYHDGPPPPYDRHYDDRGFRCPPPGYRGGPPPGGPPGGPPRGGGGGGRRRREPNEAVPGVSLLVRNVSPDITTQDLQRAFGRIGEIRDVYIPRDYHSQQPKGFAFIEYATAAQAEEARDEMHHFFIKGRELEVVFAQEKRKTPNEMRGRVVNPQNRGRDRSNFERSSSFERHRQREQEQGGSRNGGGGPPPQDDDDRPPVKDEEER